MDKKTCFVIMPIADFDPYAEGHFKRVYDYIIAPACEQAGFIAVRADDVLNTNFIALDIIKKIITSDMALCDLSGRNPNVLYELGIRQSFNLPVTLIKDTNTNRIFDIQTFRDFEYDADLRIDKVEHAVESVSEILKNTYESHSKGTEVNSLIKLLGISKAEIVKSELSSDTTLLLDAINGLSKRMDAFENQNNQKTKNSRPGRGASVSNYISDNGVELSVGDEIIHINRGRGKILELFDDGKVKVIYGDEKIVTTSLSTGFISKGAEGGIVK